MQESEMSADMFQKLADRLDRIAGEMEQFLGPPEMAPGPDADDLREAAKAIRRSNDLAAALEFYANPAVYAPHPHGPAFDRRDISYRAKNALAQFRGDEDELSPNYAACCSSTDLAACDCVNKQHIRVLFAKGGRKYQPVGDPL
jgi:hypothetical protein